MEVLHYSYDVAVLGAGPGGLTAAVAAARQGMKVLLVDRNGYLGGTLASGLPILGFLDCKARQVTGGMAEEVVDRLTEAGGSYGIKFDPHHNSTVTVHPGYMRLVAVKMCQEAGVDILLHCETVNVDVTNGKITCVSVFGKGMRVDIAAKIYMDGTGDGDVGYLAGAAYEKGHGDTKGVQPPTLMFTLGNVDHEKMFRYLDDHPEDHDDPVDFFRNEKSHSLVAFKGLYRRLREQGENPVNMPALICINSMNEGQVYINGMRLSNTDGTDLVSLTKAELDGHLQVEKLIAMLKKYVPGFEDCHLISINPAVGIRETRRLIGKKYLTIDKAMAYEVPDDTIALAAYMIDIHSPTDTKSTFIKLQEPFGIPYLTLVNRDIGNLMMVGRCISVDYQVYGSTRVMSTCMAVGEAAGIGAALAIKKNIDPADVDHNEVRKILLANKAILSL